MILRRGGHQDVRFLRDMLHHAYYWRERDPGSTAMRYVRAWGRSGDTAVIALEEGFPVGAAWFRLFPASEPGYGFVDEQTPELAIAVVPSKRGHGIGFGCGAESFDRGGSPGGIGTRGLSDPCRHVLGSCGGRGLSVGGGRTLACCACVGRRVRDVRVRAVRTRVARVHAARIRIALEPPRWLAGQ